MVKVSSLEIPIGMNKPLIETIRTKVCKDFMVDGPATCNNHSDKCFSCAKDFILGWTAHENLTRTFRSIIVKKTNKTIARSYKAGYNWLKGVNQKANEKYLILWEDGHMTQTNNIKAWCYTKQFEKLTIRKFLSDGDL